MEELALNANDWNVRSSSAKRLKDESLLKQIAENDDMSSVCYAAAKTSKNNIKSRPFSFKYLL